MTKEKRKYREFPYMERYDGKRLCRENKEAPYYGFFWVKGKKKRISVQTTDEIEAMKTFLYRKERYDQGLELFEPKPEEPVSHKFSDVARRYVEEAPYVRGGTEKLAESSLLRHKQSLFGLAKDGDGRGHVLRYFGDRDIRANRPKDVLHYIRKRQNQGVAPTRSAAS